VKYYLSYSLGRIEAEAVQGQRMLFAFGGTQCSSKTFNEKANLKEFQQYQEEKCSPIKYNCNSEIQRKFDLEVMAFFKHFVAVTDPQYNIRSSHTMSKRMTGLLYKNLEKAMEFVFETELPDCLNVAFTYSEWTSNNILTFISLSIHYINQNYEFRKITVGVDNFLEPTTQQGPNAMNLFLSVMYGFL